MLYAILKKDGELDRIYERDGELLVFVNCQEAEDALNKLRECVRKFGIDDAHNEYVGARIVKFGRAD